MQVTHIEQISTGHWIMDVERDVKLRAGLFGFGAMTVKRHEQFVSADGLLWLNAVSGERAQADIEIELEHQFDNEMGGRGSGMEMATSF